MWVFSLFAASFLAIGSVRLFLLLEMDGIFLVILGFVFLMLTWDFLEIKFFEDEMKKAFKAFLRWINKSITDGPLMIFFSFIALGVVWNFQFGKDPNHFSKLNEFGDFSGGVLGPILTFLTLFFVIRQNAEQSKKEKDRLRHEYFLKQIEMLDRKINDLSFRSRNGGSALKEFSDRNLIPTKTTEEVINFGSQLIPISNILDSLFNQVFLDRLASENSNDADNEAYSIIKFDLLSLNYSGNFINDLFMASIAPRRTATLGRLFRDNTIKGIRFYFINNQRTYLLPMSSDFVAFNTIIQNSQNPQALDILE